MKTTIDIVAAAKAEKNYMLAKAEVRLEYSATGEERWSAYGTIRKNRVMNGTLDRKTTKQIVTHGWERVSKEDAAEILGKYSLTTEQFAEMQNVETSAALFANWAKNGCSVEFLLEIGSLDDTGAKEYRAYLESQNKDTAPVKETATTEKTCYEVRLYGYFEPEERYYVVGVPELCYDLGEAVKIALADRDSRLIKFDKYGCSYKNMNYGGAMITRLGSYEPDTTALDISITGDIETDDEEVRAVLKGYCEAKSTETPAEDTASTTDTPAEPPVYFKVSGTVYGHYDSKALTALGEYLWNVNKSGKKHNKIRIEHYEGTDVEEYCGSETFDVSEYDIANWFGGTVTPWTLHQIQSYDGEDGIKVDVTAEMCFDI